MSKFARFGMCLGLFAVTGCVEMYPMVNTPYTNPSLVYAQPKDFSPALRRDMADFFTAKWIAGNCRGALSVDSMGFTSLVSGLGERAYAEAKNRGVYLDSHVSLSQFLTNDEIRQLQADFYSSHKFNRDKRLEWCAIGRAEIAKKTKIGRYLG